MIKLSKSQIPEVLRANSAKWTLDLQNEIANGGDRVKALEARYRHVDIKESLKNETSRKCAYCEGKPLSSTYGDIEHIVPKDGRPELAFDWHNLTLACDRCNTNKGIKEGIVDPYACDPEDEFEFFGPMMLHRAGKVAAERTRIELDLNRIDLMERRADAIGKIVERLSRLRATANDEEAALIRETITIHETKSDREFSACVRAFVKAKGAAGEV